MLFLRTCYPGLLETMGCTSMVRMADVEVTGLFCRRFRRRWSWLDHPWMVGSVDMGGLGHNTKGHCHPRASSAKTRGFHTQLDEGPETP